MKILIKAKPKSKTEYVKHIEGTSFVVAVKEVAEKGKANQAVTQALAQFFDIPVSSVILVSGQTSKQKIFDIPLTLEDVEKISTVGQMKLKL